MINVIIVLRYYSATAADAHLLYLSVASNCRSASVIQNSARVSVTCGGQLWFGRIHFAEAMAISEHFSNPLTMDRSSAAVICAMHSFAKRSGFVVAEVVVMVKTLRFGCLMWNLTFWFVLVCTRFLLVSNCMRGLGYEGIGFEGSECLSGGAGVRARSSAAEAVHTMDGMI